MRFLNPKTDFAFKKIFGSERNHDVLISFMNAILSLKPPHLITKIKILDPYLAPKIKGMKDSYLDIRVKDQSNRDYIIEMQVLNVAGFEKRVLYNACKAYSGQIKKGDPYTRLTNVIAVTITDFIMFKELTETTNRFMLRAANNPDISLEDLELVFAELPKFKKKLDQLDGIIDKWFYFLKYANKLNHVPKILAMEPTIQKAFTIANQANFTEKELDNQERREMFIQDQRGAITLAKKQGRKQGRKQGMEEGMQKGASALFFQLLTHRFNHLPKWVDKKLRNANPSTIEMWTARVLDGQSLDQIFSNTV